jgi:hypothetical protein
MTKAPHTTVTKTKAVAKKSSKRTSTPTTHPSSHHAKQPKTIDYYPNRMTIAVSVLAGTGLVLLCLMVRMTVIVE